MYFKYCSDVEIRSEMKNILIECRDSLAIPNAVTGSIQKGSRNNNIVIEQLNSEISALKSKAKSDELRYRLLYDEKVEELNKDVTFWVCVLAAICTIVPIVLNIASIYNMNRDFEYLKNKINVEYEDLKEEYSQLRAKIRTFESSLSNAQKKLENNYEYFKIQTTLHSIKEMRDFDWQRHHLKSERDILFIC